MRSPENRAFAGFTADAGRAGHAGDPRRVNQLYFCCRCAGTTELRPDAGDHQPGRQHSLSHHAESRSPAIVKDCRSESAPGWLPEITARHHGAVGSVKHMGALLTPIKPSSLYPRHPMDGKEDQGEPKPLRLSWRLWYALVGHLERQGIDTRSLDSDRDCQISSRKCKQIADALKDLRRVPEELRAVAAEDVLLWRNSGGFRKH